jgi:hypothetical protein
MWLGILSTNLKLDHVKEKIPSIFLLESFRLCDFIIPESFLYLDSLSGFLIHALICLFKNSFFVFGVAEPSLPGNYPTLSSLILAGSLLSETSSLSFQVGHLPSVVGLPLSLTVHVLDSLSRFLNEPNLFYVALSS